VPVRQGNAHLQIVPYQLFQTADSYLVLAVGNDGQWQRFCRAAEQPSLAQDARFTTNVLRVENRAALVPLVEKLMRGRTTAAWEERLRAAEVPHAPVWDYADLFRQPQVAARGMRVKVRDPQGRPVELLGTPFHIDGVDLAPTRMPPALGEHTTEVLEEVLGLSAGEIEALREKGVI
jgi:crotonobetainyl-CoA:carnitine CoA-transferase CaiB-like acyl-CoA transferase